MEKECAPCERCGWGPTTPRCPVEYSDINDATWKEWRPRIEKDGKSYQEELVVRKGTRREFMEQLRKVFEKCDAHDFVAEWNTHIRNYVYATFPSTEITISTDFAAQHEHKSAYTRTCEHPPRSNMAVFVVTYHDPAFNTTNADADIAADTAEPPSVGTGRRSVKPASAQLTGQPTDTSDTTSAAPRRMKTDVWRIISPAKGDSLFHNTALGQIIDYYKGGIIPDLRLCNVFTDGCRSQYKGKRNFVKVAGFPAEHNNVTLRHRFAASHHFKGPHDAYGKDAKFMARTAEKHGKARLATPHQFYYFCATSMPQPKKQRAKDAVMQMPTLSPAALEKLTETPPPPMVPGHESLVTAPSEPVVEPECDEGAAVQPIGTESVDFSEVLDPSHIQNLQGVGVHAGEESERFELDPEIEPDNELYLDPAIFCLPAAAPAAAPAAVGDDQDDCGPPPLRQRRTNQAAVQEIEQEIEQETEQEDYLQQMLAARAARDLNDAQIWVDAEADAEEKMDNGVNINPSLRARYGKSLAESAASAAQSTAESPAHAAAQPAAQSSALATDAQSASSIAAATPIAAAAAVASPAEPSALAAAAHPAIAHGAAAHAAAHAAAAQPTTGAASCPSSPAASSDAAASSPAASSDAAAAHAAAAAQAAAAQPTTDAASCPPSAAASSDEDDEEQQILRAQADARRARAAAAPAAATAAAVAVAAPAPCRCRPRRLCRPLRLRRRLRLHHLRRRPHPRPRSRRRRLRRRLQGRLHRRRHRRLRRLRRRPGPRPRRRHRRRHRLRRHRRRCLRLRRQHHRKEAQGS